mgnify:FL=1
MNFLSLFKRNIIYKFKNKKSIDKDDISNKSLNDLFIHYGSDKGDFFKKENRESHGYSSFYTKHFSNLRNKKINILEIGSFAGASAAAFSKYFPHSKIFCFDINISKFEFESEKIYVFGLDINNRKKVNKTLDKIFNLHSFKDFDLIIDDGSHNLSDMLFSFNFFFKILKNGGTYIIEDFKLPNYYKYNNNIDHIFVDEFLNNIKNKQISDSSIFSKQDQEYLINKIDKINIYKGNFDDSDICFIEKFK